MRGVGLIDETIIGWAESTCRRIQRLTGWTNFWLMGKIDLLIVVLLLREMLIVVSSRHASDVFIEGTIGVIIDSVFFVMMLHFGFFTWKRLENEAFSRLHRGLCNPSKISIIDRAIRLMLISARIIRLVEVILWHRLHPVLDIIAWCVTLHFLLFACDPLPPCSGTIRERLKAWHLIPQSDAA